MHFWLKVPLVVIAGGQVADDMVDNSIEVLDLEKDKTCSHNIAGVTKGRDGAGQKKNICLYFRLRCLENC